MSLNLDGVPRELIDTLTSGLAVFIEKAMENIATYVEHSNRSLITPKDVILGLKLEVFKFGQRDTLLVDLENARAQISREESEETDMSNSTGSVLTSTSDSTCDDIEVFCKNTCTCEICSEMNVIEQKYKEWIPCSPLEISVHRAISKSEDKFKTSPIIYE